MVDATESGLLLLIWAALHLSQIILALVAAFEEPPFKNLDTLAVSTMASVPSAFWLVVMSALYLRFMFEAFSWMWIMGYLFFPVLIPAGLMFAAWAAFRHPHCEAGWPAFLSRLCAVPAGAIACYTIFTVVPTV